MTSGHFILNTYLQGESWLHAQDVRLKLSGLLIFLLTVAGLPAGAWGAYIFLTAVLIAAMLITRISLRLLLSRSLVLELPFLLIAIPMLFQTSGKDLLFLSINGFTLTFSKTGLIAMSNLLIKTWLSIQAAVLISAVTRFDDMLVGLRGLGYPRLLTAILALMWRYFFILVHEAYRMLAARTARGGWVMSTSGKRGGSLIWRARVTGGMAGNLLLRSMERSERVYQAMKSRGYDGEVRMLANRRLTKFEKRKIFSMALFALVFTWITFQIYGG